MMANYHPTKMMSIIGRNNNIPRRFTNSMAFGDGPRFAHFKCRFGQSEASKNRQGCFTETYIVIFFCIDLFVDLISVDYFPLFVKVFYSVA